MKRYLGSMTAAAAFGSPISISLRITGYFGIYTDLAKWLNEEAATFLAKKDWITHGTHYNGLAEKEGTVYDLVAEDVGLEDLLGEGMPVIEVVEDGKKSYAPHHFIKAHEENHEEVRDLGLLDNTQYTGRAKTYHFILVESIAQVIGDLAQLEFGEDKKAAQTIIDSGSSYGLNILHIVGRTQHGHSKKSLEKKIQQTGGRNWAHILADLPYWGLYPHCIDIIKKHGKKEGKDIIYETMKQLCDDPEALHAMGYLRGNLSKHFPLPTLQPFMITDVVGPLHGLWDKGKKAFTSVVQIDDSNESKIIADELGRRIKNGYISYFKRRSITIADNPTT